MPQRLHIGIIGAGVAGASAALFTRDAFRHAEITVLERSRRSGGRLRAIPLGSGTLEMGGSFLHASNRLALELLRRLDLKLRLQPVYTQALSSVGIWNGREFVVQLRVLRPVSNVRALASYGGAILTLRSLAKQFLRRWSRMYAKEDVLGSDSCLTLLSRCDLAELAQCASSAMLAENGVSARFAVDVVSSITRATFVHDLDINGLAGLIGVVGTGLGGGRSGSVVGGNERFCEALLRAASVRLELGTEIAKISVEGSAGVAVLDRRGCQRRFDAVITAVPNRPQPAHQGRVWSFPTSTSLRGICTTVVIGRVNLSYFGLSKGDVLPRLILSTSGADSAVTTLRRCGPSGETASVYKIQSQSPLGTPELERVFSDIEDVRLANWPECPDLSPVTADRSFRLAPNIYDASAVEAAVSTIESQLLGSRNAVRLLREDR